MTQRASDAPRLRVEIPFMVRTGAAPRHGAPTVLLEPASRLATAYDYDAIRDHVSRYPVTRFSGGFDLKVLMTFGPEMRRLLRTGFEG